MTFRGIATFCEHLRMADGSWQSTFYADNWRVVGPGEVAEIVGAEKKFRLSSDTNWMVAAYVEGRDWPVMVVPGCKLIGWTAADSCPAGDTFDLTGNR